MEKRKDYINWNEYFMSSAVLSAMRSKDPKTQVGCCIVDPSTNRIVSMGYNGLPRGCDDEIFNWGRDDDDDGCNKYHFVVHAELNAILNAKCDLTGYHLYVTYSPCNECAKAIVQSGIKKVIYINDYKPNTPGSIASRRILNNGRVETELYTGNTMIKDI